MALTTRNIRPGARGVLAAWAALGALLLALTAAFTYWSALFGYAHEVRDMPVFALAGGLALAGALVLLVPSLVGTAKDLPPRTVRALLWAMLAAGLAMRLVLFASEPALEDDYQRYLWDGAVTANGLDPYARSPREAMHAPPHSPLWRLAVESGPVLGRVNHPHLRTLYPPVAQGAFALAHVIGPWSLTAWRALILACDLAAVALLLILLRDLGRAPLWAALYWWNPVVLKELFNTAHMEALVAPLVLGGLVLAARRRPVAASAALTLAAGAKIWPLILLPLVWRGLLDRPKRLALAMTMTAASCALFAWPIVSAGLDDTSGLVAYASEWKTNSALFPLVEGFSGATPARVLVALALAAIVAWQCREAAPDAEDLTRKALIIAAAAFLLSPAQFPWYYLWVLPLLACFPAPGLLILTVTLPLYYTAFHYLARGEYETFSQGIVWLIWLPAWGLLVWQARRQPGWRASPRFLRRESEAA